MDKLEAIKSELIFYQNLKDSQLKDLITKLKHLINESENESLQEIVMELQKGQIIELLINLLKIKKNQDNDLILDILIIICNMITDSDKQMDFLFKQQIHRIFLKVIVDNMPQVIDCSIPSVLLRSMIVAFNGLSNLASHSLQTRIEVHNLNISYAVADVLKSKYYDLYLMRALSFLLFNICKVEKNTDVLVMKPLIPIVIELMKQNQKHDNDLIILKDLLWCFAYIVSVNNSIELLIEKQVFQVINQTYSQSNYQNEIMDVVFYTFGFCTFQVSTIDYFMGLGTMKTIINVIQIDNFNKIFLMKNCINILSNIALGSNSQVQSLFYIDSLIPNINGCKYFINNLIINDINEQNKSLLQEITILINNLTQIKTQNIQIIIIDNKVILNYILKLKEQNLVQDCEHYLNQIIDIILKVVAFIQNSQNIKNYNEEVNTLHEFIIKMQETIILQVFETIKKDLCDLKDRIIN